VQQKSLRRCLLNFRKQKIAAWPAEVWGPSSTSRCVVSTQINTRANFCRISSSRVHITPHRRLGPKEDVLSRQLIHTSLGKLIRFGTKPYQLADRLHFAENLISRCGDCICDAVTRLWECRGSIMTRALTSNLSNCAMGNETKDTGAREDILLMREKYPAPVMPMRHRGSSRFEATQSI
jgi:hypothetical protein